MKRNRIVAAAIIAGLLAAGSGAVLAKGDRCNDGPRGHGKFGPFAAAYHLDNLSDEQRNKLDALREKHQGEMAQQMDERKALREAIHNASDAKTLRPLAEKEGQAVTEMIMKRAALRGEMEKILTKEQVAQLEQMRAEREERFQKRQHGPF